MILCKTDFMKHKTCRGIATICLLCVVLHLNKKNETKRVHTINTFRPL